jgi:translocation and assembly module TamA
MRLISIIRITPLSLLLSLTVPDAIADVTINGLNAEAKKNVQLLLSLSKEQCDSPDWKIQALFGKADEQIKQALRALGYYHPTIAKSLAFTERCWQTDFTVNAGPPAIVDDIGIIFTGDTDTDFQKLRDELLKERGKPLRHDRYEKMKSRIEALAMDKGYLKGTFTEKKLLIDKAGNKAHIKLEFAAGKRMVFGDVNVEQTILDPEFVDKFILIKSGDYYSTEQLGKTHNALSKSGYFERIDIRPDTEHSNERVPVTISLFPRRRHHYEFGIGYDTDIGPLVSGGYNNHRLNRHGHFVDANLNLAPVLSTADAEYSVPLADPVNDFFSFGGGFKREDTATYKSLSAKLSARLKHDYDNGWRQTLFIDSIYEDFNIGGTTSNSVLLLAPGGSWLRSVSDNVIRPTKGHRLELNVAGSYENPISDVSFAQGSVSAVLVRPSPWNGKFIARAQQGATLTDHFEKLPTSYRFYAGGMNSVRGYGYKELGPRDNFGNVIGGKFLTVLSAEYEQFVFADWGVAAFVDGGNAYNLDSIRIKTGAGLGVRWYSPIGPIRLDFALPLSESDSSFQIHFAAGARI